MSDRRGLRLAPAGRRAIDAPLMLLVGSIALYVGVALWTGETKMLETDGVIGLLQRMVALGIVALGQTFAILAGSIDLSVANMISVAAVLASFIMQGRPEMMLPAVAVVLAVSALVGVVNGVLISRLQVNPLIATLGVGLILQGLLSASFTDFAGRCRANSRRSPMARSASCPIRSRRCSFSPAVCSSVLLARHASAHISTPSAATPKARGSPGSAPTW